MIKMKVVLILVFLLPFYKSNGQRNLFVTSNGKVNFTSDAPLELIKAASDQLTGVLNTTDKTFLFSIKIISFEGFNSTLQRTHFNENYMESDKYPKATFEGKIIEEIDFSKPGTYNIRSKGKFTVHGIIQDRIIPCKLIISENSIKVTSTFSVFLQDHDIKIPSVVSQKIAEEISVEINFVLKPKT